MKTLRKFIDSQWFQNFILAVIIINCILMGMQTSSALVSRFGTLMSTIDTICLIIFVIELFAKLLAYGKEFVKSGWNWFDTIIVAVSVFSGMQVFSVLRVFRIFRVFRSLKALKGLRGFRLLSSVRHLQIIVTALLRSLPGIAWSSVLLLLIFYIYSLIGVSLFGPSFPDWFGSIGKALYTLFQVMTLESWSMGISRPVMEVFGWAWIYFVSFVLISAFVMMNVVVGIVVNAISEVTESDKLEAFKNSSAKNELTVEDRITDELAQIREHMGILEKLIDVRDKADTPKI